MGSNRTLLSFLLSASLAIGIWTGCGDDEPVKPAPKPAAGEPASKPAPVVKQPPPTSIQEQLEKQVDLPDFYPADAPVYPGAKASSAGWVRGRVSAVFSTQDSAAQVSTHLEEALAEQEWSNVQSADMPNGQVVQGFKSDEDRKIMILVSEIVEKGATVTLIAVSTDP